MFSMEGKSRVLSKSSSPTEIKKQIQASLRDIAELRNLSSSSLSRLSSMKNEEKLDVLRKCRELKSKLEERTKEFNTPSKKIEIVNKLLKSERKKKWKLKRRRLQRVQYSFYRSMLAERNRYVLLLIDSNI